MQLRALKYIGFSLFLWASCPVTASEEARIGLHIVTPVWDGWTNEDGTGLYLELTEMIFEPRGYVINVEICHSVAVRCR